MGSSAQNQKQTSTNTITTTTSTNIVQSHGADPVALTNALAGALNHGNDSLLGAEREFLSQATSILGNIGAGQIAAQNGGQLETSTGAASLSASAQTVQAYGPWILGAIALYILLRK